MSMRPVRWLFPLALSGCLFSTSTDTPVEVAEYVTPDSPAHVLSNLALALTRKDLETIRGHLAPEYRFEFGPEPGAPCPAGPWSRETDLELTGALLADPDLRRLTLQFDYSGAEPATDVGREGQMRIRPDASWIEATFRDNTSRVSAGDLEEFYFRPGNPDLGENPGHWFLVEWRDFPGFTAPDTAAGDFTPVEPVRWWALKCEYYQP